MEIKRICVIGMGTMGSQIGIVCANAGLQTFMVDVSQDRIQRGLESIRLFLEGRQKRGKMSKESVERTLSLINTRTDIGEALSQADLVIEAVYEDIEIKKEVFKKMDSGSPAETILASNTSTLWISEIAASTSRPEKCIGTHFLIPAALTPLVEVVRGLETSDETHSTVINFLQRCGKETVTVADSPGFVINRLYLPLVNEAFFLLEAGLASAAEIDRTCTLGLAFPLGPLAAADAFGLDILLDCMKTFHRELGDKYCPAPLLVRLVKAGRLGRKTGRGVYDYRK
ncbi:MAG: 3-hydroxybutyryl-CoA dehydrogenase [Deltaproteobacteria bacterium]|nr:3-hydroxybutyryl-CoA dehydrogenase [Deltaproteobacteria bacterium]